MMIEVVIVLAVAIAKVWAENENVATGFQSRCGGAENSEELVPRAAVFEKIAHKDGVEMSGCNRRREVFGRDLVHRDLRCRVQARFRIEIDGDSLGCHRIVDELAIAGANLQNPCVTRNIPRKPTLTQDFPDGVPPGQHLLGKTMAIELLDSRFESLWSFQFGCCIHRLSTHSLG
jgi:hypothetical protein